MPLPLAILRETWLITAQMAPYLLVGFAAAGALSLVLTPDLVQRAVGGRGWFASFKAVLIGIPLPLCSCSVIPVTAALRQHGAGPGAAAAFLTATPQTGVDSILATHALMGPWFAAYRVLAAFISGMVAGIAVDAVGGGRKDGQKPSGNSGESCGCCCHGAPPDSDGEHGHDAAENPGGSRWLRAARFGFIDLPRDIGGHLALGLLISGVIGATVPPDVLSSISPPWYLAYAAAMAIGLPLYVCSTASIPMASAMIAAGLSPGAALIFLITGPATNAATLATASNLIGGRGAAAYLAALVVTSWGMGALADALPFAPSVAAHVHAHCESISAWHHAAAAVLCGMLVIPALGRMGRKRTWPNA